MKTLSFLVSFESASGRLNNSHAEDVWHRLARCVDGLAVEFQATGTVCTVDEDQVLVNADELLDLHSRAAAGDVRAESLGDKEGI